MGVGPWKPPGTSEVEMAAVVGCLRIALAAATPPQTKSGVGGRTMIEDWFKVPKTASLIAKAETGQVQGVVFFRMEPPIVRILYVAVLDPRKGLGSQLVGALRELCSKKGVKEIRASYSQKDPRAAAFFTKKLGFADQGPAGEVLPGFPLVDAALAIPAAAGA